MKKLMIGLAAAVVCCTVARAAEGQPSGGYLTIGPSYMLAPDVYGLKDMDLYGVDLGVGTYVAQGDVGAARLGVNLGVLYGDASYLGAKVETWAVPILASVSYEFRADPVRFRVGPVAGVTISHNKFSVPGWGNGDGWDVDFTYGGEVGLSVDLADNMFVDASYRYLRYEGGDLSDAIDYAHQGTVAIGFRF